MDQWLTVYASSSDAVAPHFFGVAAALGRQIAERKYHLLYGGTNVGLMGAVARAVKGAGGKVVGVIPKKIADSCPPPSDVDELIITEKMSERKAILEERSSGFIALPGGFGTLEELLEIITLKQLHYHNKPIAILNHERCFEPLLAQFRYLFDQQFAKPSYSTLYYVADSVEAAMQYIADYRPVEREAKWFVSK